MTDGMGLVVDCVVVIPHARLLEGSADMCIYRVIIVIRCHKLNLITLIASRIPPAQFNIDSIITDGLIDRSIDRLI